MGLEVSGIVHSVGRDVPSHLAQGTHVAALLPGGGYAQYAVAHHGHVMPLPRDPHTDRYSITLEQAAAIPEVWCTAYLNLCLIGRLQEKRSVLIHAGASGVGIAAIQIAKMLGIGVIATTSSTAKCDSCVQHGATLAIDYTKGVWANELLQHCPDGVELILDSIGASYFRDNVRVLGTDGHLVCIGLQGGSSLVTEMGVELSEMLWKRATVSFSTLRSRTTEFKSHLCSELLHFTDQMQKFSDGSLSVAIDRVFEWNDVEQAHRWMAENRNIGKILLKVSRGDRQHAT